MVRRAPPCMEPTQIQRRDEHRHARKRTEEGTARAAPDRRAEKLPATPRAADGVLAQSHAVSSDTDRSSFGPPRNDAHEGVLSAHSSPQAYSRQLTANGRSSRCRGGSKSVITGTLRFFAPDARRRRVRYYSDQPLSTESVRWRGARARREDWQCRRYQMLATRLDGHGIASIRSRPAVIDSSDRLNNPVRRCTPSARRELP